MRTYVCRALVLGLALGFLGAGCAPVGPGAPRVAENGPAQAVEEVQEPVAEEPEAVEPEKPAVPAPEPEQSAPVVHTITVLPVPFTVQAPHAVWDEAHEEACEEASILMAVDYAGQREDLRIPPDEAEQRLQELIAWEGEHGYAVDLTAEETARVLGERFGLKAKAVRYDAETVRQELRARRPVIIPAAGRLLGNPYFTSPGPLYHMLVIKGYEGDEFITNDPGTKRGESYRYREPVFETAVHDWNNGDVADGQQMMVVLEP